MTRFGLCVNVGEGGWPSTADLERFGIADDGLLRTIIYGKSQFEGRLSELPSGVKVCALAQPAETEGIAPDGSGAVEFARWLVSRPLARAHVIAAEIWNEADLLGIPIERAIWITNAVAPIYAAAGIRPIMPSVAGPDWQGYAEQLAWNLSPEARAVVWANGHFYGQRMNEWPPAWQVRSRRHPPLARSRSGKHLEFGHVVLIKSAKLGEQPRRVVRWGFGEWDSAVWRLHALTGLPCANSEQGIKIGDAGSEESQAEYVRRYYQLASNFPEDVLPLSCYFAAYDAVGSSGEQGSQAFGLVATDRRWRLAAMQVQAYFGGVDVPIPPADDLFDLGFKKWHDLEPSLIGSALARERNTGFPGWQVQPTSNGILSWHEGNGHIFVAHSGRVFRWEESWSSSVEVP